METVITQQFTVLAFASASFSIFPIVRSSEWDSWNYDGIFGMLTAMLNGDSQIRPFIRIPERSIRDWKKTVFSQIRQRYFARPEYPSWRGGERAHG